MPQPIVALARRYQQNALRISTVGEDRGHGDISYQAMAIAPADIERAVVNLLRLHDAETAMLFCATRDNVRHLHASLTERGFAVVALSGEHSQNERNAALQALRDRRAKVCVATDVAARGIDLPSLSLVIHVEIPRDAETLQHRSGRTGRAGKKGTAILLVPYPRRRRVEGMLRGARIAAEWVNPPSAADIRVADNDRMLEALLAPVEIDDTDRELVARLLVERTPEEVAAALVQAHRARMPQPEELLATEAPPPKGPREGFEGSSWFRLNVGRRNNADPRWILPLICRRGHVSRSDIGAIRLAANETLFEIAGPAAARFLEAVGRTAEEDDGVEIIAVDGAPRDDAKRVRREYQSPGGTRSGPHKPKPYNQGPRQESRGDAHQAKPFRKKGPGGQGGWKKKPDQAR
jgi:ATP-dependent RNA helicase DeaD